MTISVESFFLDLATAGTLQRRIRHMVADGVLAGRFRPGEKMPSSRKLAGHLGVSRITVTTAYSELVADDYLVARGRSGYFVSDSAPSSPTFDALARPSEKTFDWARAIGHRFSGHDSLARPPDWREKPYPFVYGQADARLFDHHNWRLCAVQALGRKDFEALTSDLYDCDDPKLIEFILRNILPRRGISARPEEILITLGAQNALWISTQILMTQRRTAVMENPGYPGLKDILLQTRCRLIAIDVDDGGLPPDLLPDDADVVFTTVSHHCPTGVTMPLERRLALLELAARRGFVIVEDDYEFELSFKRSPSPALKSLDQGGAVIYVGSFSKSLAPGLRLGYLVASKPFIREARALRSLIMRHPPGSIQRTAAYFLSLGHYDTQINTIRKAYQSRRSTMEAAMLEHGLIQACPSTAGGSSFWMRAPNGVDTGVLARRLYRRGVVIEPGQVFFAARTPPSCFYRLAYSSIPGASIAEGIARISQEINQTGPTSTS